jgi:serine/threonine protein kinase
VIQDPLEHPVGRIAVPGPGSQVAGYLLEEQVGAGGMAIVYRAGDVRLGRLVALKVMAAAMAGDETFRKRFIREARAAAAVDDPHIIPVYEAGEADGVLFMAMRFVGGGDVRSLLRRKGPLSPHQVMSLISPVASALDAAHAAGLVHRDVKPANMLLDVHPGRPDHVYLSDFGLSKSGRSGQLTGTGEFLGTPDYTAPEQIEGTAADGRADQYALACSAFELLTGTTPFARGEGWATVWAHLNTPPPALTSWRPDLPPVANEMFARAMAKAPRDRYGSCREFCDALRDAFGLGPYQAPAFGPAAPVAGTGPSQFRGTTVTGSPPLITQGNSAASGRLPARPRRRRYGMIMLAGAVLLAAAAIIVVLAVPALTSAPRPRSSAAPPSSATPPSSAASPLYSRIGAFTPPRVPGYWHEVTSVAFSPDGKYLATGLTTGRGDITDPRTFGGMTFLWNVATGKQSAVLTGAGGAEAFSADGKLLAFAGGTGHNLLYLANAQAGAAIGGTAAALPGTGNLPISDIAFNPDGDMVAAADTGGGFYLWSITSGTTSGTLLRKGLQGSPSTALAFSPDMMTLATNGIGGVYLWNTELATGPPSSILPNPGTFPISSVAFSPDDTMIAATAQGGQVILWYTATGRHIDALAVPGGLAVEAVAFSPDGGLLAAGDANGKTYLWNVRTEKLAAVLANPAGSIPPVLAGQTGNAVESVAFSPDGKTLATSDANGSAYLWRVR